MRLIKQARLFAEEAHAGQVRKYTGQPYIVHPVSVALLVHKVCRDENVVAAALLHDVVEDTEFSRQDISRYFGDRVAKLVDQVTDVSRPEHGNRAERKRRDRLHLGQAEPDAKTIKLADLIDNTRSIVEHDSKFAKVYIAEKRELLKVLSEGDRQLFQAASDFVDAYYNP